MLLFLNTIIEKKPDGRIRGKLAGGTFLFNCLEDAITVHRQRPDLSSPDCLQTLSTKA